MHHQAVSIGLVVIFEVCLYFHLAVICTSAKQMMGQIDEAVFASEEGTSPIVPPELDLISQLDRPASPSHPEIIENHPGELDLISKLNVPASDSHQEPFPQSGAEHLSASLLQLSNPAEPSHDRSSTAQGFFPISPLNTVPSGVGSADEAQRFREQITRPILSLRTPSTSESGRLERSTAQINFPTHLCETNRFSSRLTANGGFPRSPEHTSHRFFSLEGSQTVAEQPPHTGTIAQEPFHTPASELRNVASGLTPVGELPEFSQQRPRPLVPLYETRNPAQQRELGTETSQEPFHRLAELGIVPGGLATGVGRAIFDQWTSHPYFSDCRKTAPVAQGQFGSNIAQEKSIPRNSRSRSPRTTCSQLPNIEGLQPEGVIDVELYESRRKGKAPLIQGTKRRRESENPSEELSALPHWLQRMHPAVGEPSHRHGAAGQVGSTSGAENAQHSDSNKLESFQENTFGTRVESVGAKGVETRVYKYINAYESFRAVWMSCLNPDSYKPRLRAFHLSLREFSEIEVTSLELSNQVSKFVPRIMARWAVAAENSGVGSFVDKSAYKMGAVQYSIVSTIYLIKIMNDIFYPSLYEDINELREGQKEAFRILKSFWESIFVPHLTDPQMFINLSSPYLIQNKSEKLEMAERLPKLEKNVPGHYIAVTWLTIWHWMKVKMKDVFERIKDEGDQKIFIKLVVDKVMEQAGILKPDLVPEEVRIEYKRIFKLERYPS